MKIYQLHEYYGEWEDFRDYIRGSYLRKERAEEAKIKAEAENKELVAKSRKCSRCPFIADDDFELGVLLLAYSDYCSEVALEDTPYGTNCKNYCCVWEESDFEIIEVEVEE